MDDRWNKISAKPRLSTMRRWASSKSHREAKRPSRIATALAWAQKGKVPVGGLAESKNITTALPACAQKLGGKPASSSCCTRRRCVLCNILQRTVQRGHPKTTPSTGWTG
ncbi:hypothetical protein GCM10009678_12540 [Actinomadura kijaniata]